MVDPEELSPRLVRSRRAWWCPPLQDTQIDIRPTLALSPRLLLRRSPAVIAAALARSTSRIDMFAHCRQYMRDGIRRRRPTTQTAVSMSGTQMICVFFSESFRGRRRLKPAEQPLHQNCGCPSTLQKFLQIAIRFTSVSH